MRVLTAAELLTVWERVWSQRPFLQALALLAAACPETPIEELEQLSIGRRDERLLTLRRWLFGSQITTLAACPQCGERLETQFDVEAICVPAAPSAAADSLHCRLQDHEVTFRLPNSLDLAAVDPAMDIAERRQELLERCVLHVEHKGAAIEPSHLPVEVAAELVEQMSEMDPQAHIELQLTCPGCDHVWLSTFDVVSFLFAEIQVWAHRLLGEVHVLASTYGWSEAEILAMSATRRQIYLNMALA